MRFIPTCIEGSLIIEPERIEDERGFFARTFCVREFANHGLETAFVQASISYNRNAYTLRGMHFQSQPNAEAKLVSCRAGVMYDVVVDLRPESPSFRRWFAVELTPVNARMIYVPANCAHGFMTLTDNTEVFYQMTTFHEPSLDRGLRWDDPIIGITWPRNPVIMSKRDTELPGFTEVAGRVVAARKPSVR